MLIIIFLLCLLFQWNLELKYRNTFPILIIIYNHSLIKKIIRFLNNKNNHFRIKL
jgi:hypothetical protein